ncbi:MAG: hypothetical protein LBC74_15855 [Planctomycetaceae bacterium]|nr:hypothetical protein [Planctomycetaceae bacterium]
MKAFNKQAAICICAFIALVSFVMMFLIGDSLEYKRIPEPVMSAQWIGTTQCKDGCHFSCRRHGCSWYNSPCLDDDQNCPTTDFGRDSAVPASCQLLNPPGSKTCKLDQVLVTYNKCNYTGEKDLESVGCVNSSLLPSDPDSCTPPSGKKRCVITMGVKWNDDNADKVLVYRERSNSTQCKNDPALYDENETGKYRALCNEYGGKEELSQDKSKQTRTIYGKNSQGQWVKIKQERTREKNNSTNKWGRWSDWKNLSEELVE